MQTILLGAVVAAFWMAQKFKNNFKTFFLFREVFYCVVLLSWSIMYRSGWFLQATIKGVHYHTQTVFSHFKSIARKQKIRERKRILRGTKEPQKKQKKNVGLRFWSLKYLEPSRHVLPAILRVYPKYSSFSLQYSDCWCYNLTDMDIKTKS